MNITINLKHGNTAFNIDADSDEEYLSELEKIFEFIERNEGQFSVTAQPRVNESLTSGTVGSGEFEAPTDEQAGQSDLKLENKSLAKAAQDLEIGVSQLEELVHIDPDGQEPPFLILDDVEILGSLKKERQRTASLLLLYFWDMCYGQSVVSSTELSQALQDSDISSTNMFHMYEDEGKKYFNQSGSGPGSKVELRNPGHRQAKSEIKRIVEEIDLD